MMDAIYAAFPVALAALLACVVFWGFRSGKGFVIDKAQRWWLLWIGPLACLLFVSLSIDITDKC